MSTWWSTGMSHRGGHIFQELLCELAEVFGVTWVVEMLAGRHPTKRVDWFVDLPGGLLGGLATTHPLGEPSITTQAPKHVHFLKSSMGPEDWDHHEIRRRALLATTRFTSFLLLVRPGATISVRTLRSDAQVSYYSSFLLPTGGGFSTSP